MMPSRSYLIYECFISHVGGKHTTDKRYVTSDGTLNSLPLVADIPALPIQISKFSLHPSGLPEKSGVGIGSEGYQFRQCNDGGSPTCKKGTCAGGIGHTPGYYSWDY
jgi:hypothetical protein